MVVLLGHLDSFSLPARRQGGAIKRLDLSMHDKLGLSFLAWRWELSWACRVQMIASNNGFLTYLLPHSTERSEPRSRDFEAK
jgi:hypothetical protein